MELSKTGDSRPAVSPSRCLSWKANPLNKHYRGVEGKEKREEGAERGFLWFHSTRGGMGNEKEKKNRRWSEQNRGLLLLYYT